MKKLILTIAFLASYVTAAYSQGSMGFTVNLADIDTLSDDIDNNGSTDTTKDISNDQYF